MYIHHISKYFAHFLIQTQVLYHVPSRLTNSTFGKHLLCISRFNRHSRTPASFLIENRNSLGVRRIPYLPTYPAKDWELALPSIPGAFSAPLLLLFPLISHHRRDLGSEILKKCHPSPQSRLPDSFRDVIHPILQVPNILGSLPQLSLENLHMFFQFC